MKFARTMIWINCALFIAFGLGFTLAPGLVATLITGAEPATTSAMIDMRATYGGMALGLATMFWFCAMDERLILLGVRGIVAVMVFLSVSRLLGIVVDGSPNAFMYLLLGAEVLMAVLGAMSLRLGRYGSLK